jgi:nucleotide-binding universal stress UspA family protein
MAFKDVLVALTTYPQATPVSAVDDAVSFAAALGTRISALACEVKIPVPGSILSHAVLDVPAMIGAEAKKSAINAEKLLVSFQDAAEKSGVYQERILETCLTSEVASMLVDYARLRDLTIVPLAEGDHIGRWYAESIIFGSGRPTMILPATRKGTDDFALNTAVVAWDFSRPAARAVADALPILEKMQRVFVLTVSNEKMIDTKRSGAELAKHLARHGINITLDVVDAAGRSVGEAIESYVGSRHGDLLVMGAYGHSRVREFILGGATKSVLARPSLSILLSH